MEAEGCISAACGAGRICHFKPGAEMFVGGLVVLALLYFRIFYISVFIYAANHAMPWVFLFHPSHVLTLSDTKAIATPVSGKAEYGEQEI